MEGIRERQKELDRLNKIQEGFTELERANVKILAVKKLKELQVKEGNPGESDYVRGLHHGTELALSLLEGRIPDYQYEIRGAGYEN